MPGVDGGQWSVVGRAYTPNHRYISWGDLVLTSVYISVLHLYLFLFMQFYVNAYSACMEIKITKLDEEKVYNEGPSFNSGILLLS